MANISYIAIRTAIRERLLGTLTTGARDVTVGRLLGEASHGLDDAERKRRSLSTPRFDISFINSEKHPNGPPITFSVGLVKISIKVLATYSLPAEVLTDLARDQAVSVAETDADIIRQALTWPGCLTSTSASVATGIVSGCLTWLRSEVVREEWGQASTTGSGLLEVEHNFEATVQVTQEQS